ncbi:MAG: hypothetical protein K2O04_06295 [Clostridiales bacterium]|nr:hypothetical protein [Clostridiales bacterium]
MKKYFVYELKKSLFVMCALAVIATAVYVISVITQVADMLDFGYRHLNIAAIVVMGGVISVIVPIWKLSYLMKKRSVDLYYSMPLSHTRILAVKLLVGLVVLFASFTVAYWIGCFTAMGALSRTEQLKNVSFIPLYFSLFVPMTIIYALTAFIFTRANRFIDGIMFVFMTGFSLGMIADVVIIFMRMAHVQFYDSNYHDYFYSFSSINFTPLGALNLISSYFSGNMFKNVSTTIGVTAFDWVGLSLVCALGVAAGVGLFFAQRKAKAENCEQISESFFGYKVMIPLYAFCFAITSARASYVLVALVAAAAYAVSVLYKRTPKIGWKFALIVGVAFLAGVGLSFLQYA